MYGGEALSEACFMATLNWHSTTWEAGVLAVQGPKPGMHLWSGLKHSHTCGLWSQECVWWEEVENSQLPRFKISGKGALEMPRTSLDVPDMTVPVLLAQGSPNGVCS